MYTNPSFSYSFSCAVNCFRLVLRVTDVREIGVGRPSRYYIAIVDGSFISMRAGDELGRRAGQEGEGRENVGGLRFVGRAPDNYDIRTGSGIGWVRSVRSV